MKTIVIPSLLAACIAISASGAVAMPTVGLGRSIAVDDSTSLHQVAGNHHRARGCRFSHGRLICGGRDRGHHGSDRGRSRKHHGGGSRHH